MNNNSLNDPAERWRMAFGVFAKINKFLDRV